MAPFAGSAAAAMSLALVRFVARFRAVRSSAATAAAAATPPASPLATIAPRHRFNAEKVTTEMAQLKVLTFSETVCLTF